MDGEHHADGIPDFAEYAAAAEAEDAVIQAQIARTAEISSSLVVPAGHPPMSLSNGERRCLKEGVMEKKG